MQNPSPYTDPFPVHDMRSAREKESENAPVYHFHILQSARRLYAVDEELFGISGNVIFANFYQARSLASAMNKKRDILRFPETAIKAGHINAMGLIDEILHYITGLYKQKESADVMGTALGHLKNIFKPDEIDALLTKFIELYPSPEVSSNTKAADYLRSTTEGTSNREIVLEEIVHLWLANTNPAFEPFIELFDHTELKETTVYADLMTALEEFFDTQPCFGPKNQNLIQMLESPAKASPESLSGQLAYMEREWGSLLGKYLLRLLQALDFIKEEDRPFFTGPGPTHVYTYDEDGELERFTRDKEWMPRVVLLAKSTYVWLHQLSKKYKSDIHRLDQIPDEELNILSSRGFTALWLIGLWERSPASKRIKQKCGNPEAEASAYSLMEYEIAADLGGWEALENLRHRCSLRGIRLSSDMVPNHTGIDSKWLIDHPDWFIQLPYPPFPQYSYSGENLHPGDRVEVFIEDHYYDKTDAAVTFKRLDTGTGETRYIYHGNDGTSMPWNDTAQLNFLDPEVREAVIRTILHVARNFPIIRFDAAMTLTKKHFQRLWFPEPGSGGDIPSRAEHSLSREDFHRAIPVEFWREVVDRITEELPETLLIAEAFWLMEGYFVRTLGMHRVYNSAFMNMLKNEENEKYRNTIKNTQEFDPDILKRFVNFMSNPDEETALAQFGEDDKYFGACTMMATVPGLPMFGHGQIEGYAEKYGMEYRRSYWDEQENYGLIQRHEREIFPLLKRRYIFAEVTNFLLFDVFTSEGRVDENVFVFCNRCENESALVMYNNAYHNAEGWIHMSAAYADKQPDGSKRLVQKNIAQGLDLPADYRTFVIFRDHKTDLWYIRNCKEIWDKGMYLFLKGYEVHVFLDFYTVADNEYGHYNQLATELSGKGTADVQRALQEIFLSPVHSILRRILNNQTVLTLYGSMKKKPGEALPDTDRYLAEYVSFLEEAALYVPEIIDTAVLSKQKERLKKWLEASQFTGRMLQAEMGRTKKLYPDAARIIRTTDYTLYVLLLLPFYLSLSDSCKNAGISDQLLLSKPVSDSLNGILPDRKIDRIVSLLELLTRLEEILETSKFDALSAFTKDLFQCQEMTRFIGENRFDDVLYFNKEAYELAMWFFFTVKIMFDRFTGASEKKLTSQFEKRMELFAELLSMSEKAGYATEKFTSLLQKG